MIVDIYTHIFPDRIFQELERGSPKLGNMGKRLRGVRKLFDLDLRFRDMDEIGDYRQIISLPNPPIEDVAEGAVANNLAKVANDSMAELCAKHPDRFPGFAAADDIVFLQAQPPVGGAFAGLDVVFVAVPRADEVHPLLGELLPDPGLVRADHVLNLVHDQPLAGRTALVQAHVGVGVELAAPVEHADVVRAAFDDFSLALG